MENEKQVKPEVGTIYLDWSHRFFEVVEVKESSVVLRAIASKAIMPAARYGSFNFTPLMPCPGQYVPVVVNGEMIIEPFERSFQTWEDYPPYSVLIDNENMIADIWNGRPTNALVLE